MPRPFVEDKKSEPGRRGTRVVALLAAGVSVVGLAAAGATSAQAAPTTGASQPPLTDAQARALSANANQKVIVVLKNQPTVQKAGTPAASARTAAVQAAQRPLLSELSKVHAGNVRSYQLVSAVAATVSAGEAARLKANPDVASVVPDSSIRLAAPNSDTGASTAAPKDGALTPHVIPGACPTSGSQLEPEALQTTATDSQTAGAKTARSLGYDGAGVTVAWIAEGIDPQNVNFLRANGTSVFSDYQDFSGDGPNSQTDGAEAFLDANAIAGQGRHVYNVANFSAQAQATACRIRIEGMAPGVNMVGLKVFSNGVTTESNFLQAINYAVQTDHVNVLNESFGANNFPDTAVDVTKQFDDAAVAAGATVTVSTGDAGPFNTTGSPATDPLLLSVAGSTTFRFQAQTNYALARDIATTGWLNNNISALSSSGYDITGRVPDLVAPGDLGWASCDASATFYGCVNFKGQPSDVEESGGTSMSAPLAAGAAALVIQAYRAGHAGATPTPAQVKQILISSTDDLKAPAAEQGAGQINTYRAVLLAKSLGTSTRTGNTISLSAGQLNTVAPRNSARQWPLTVTNDGTATQTVNLSGRTLGPDTHVQTGTVDLEDASSPQTPNYQGLPNNYAFVHFTVSPGQDRLDLSVAYPGDPAKGNNARVRFSVVDPSGRFAGHSFPQGVGNYGEFDVQQPTPGVWTGLIFGDAASVNGTNGVVHWRAATEKYVPFAQVSTPSLTLAPGRSATVRVSAVTPANAGDQAGSIVVTSGPSGGRTSTTSVSVTLRSLIDPTAGGQFAGTLTGGNGRPNGQGQEQYYQFQVGSHVPNIAANLSFRSNPSNPVAEYLVSPDGDTLGYAQNTLGGKSLKVLTAYTLNPVPGTWTLIVDFAEPVSGTILSQPYWGSVLFNQSGARASTLPNSSSTKLAAGHAVTVPVTITNKGVAPAAFFIDARSSRTTMLPLASLNSFNSGSLPISGYPQYFVPTQTAGLAAQATGSVPVMFDYGPNVGDPDLSNAAPGSASLCSNNPTSNYAPSGGSVTSGVWFIAPSECGPYGDSGMPSGTYTVGITAATKAFDTAVTSPTGDVELAAQDPSASARPVVIPAGGSVIVNVTITPNAAPGTTVTGTLFVDTAQNSVAPYGQYTASEVAALPYKYTVK